MVELEQHAVFWESLEELESQGDPELIGEVIAVLAKRILEDPYRVAPNLKGIRVAKSPSAEVNGRFSPALRLAYQLTLMQTPNGGDGIITLLHVRAFDEQQEFLETLPPAGEHPH